MEQYWMPKKLDFKNLRLCLDNYKAERLYIGFIGGGTIYRTTKFAEDLNDRKLDFKKDKSGLRLFVDSKEIFHFPLKDYEKGFSLAYERIWQLDGWERMIILRTGEEPYNPFLPEPRKSFLRQIWDSHLVEIFFEGRIDIKFHSWWQKPHWKYWTIDKPKKAKSAVT